MLSAVPWGCKQDRGHMLRLGTGFAGHWLAYLDAKLLSAGRSCSSPHVRRCVHAAGGALLPTCDRVRMKLVRDRLSRSLSWPVCC